MARVQSPEDLARAPTKLDACRVVLHAPDLAFGEVFAASLNRSLPMLQFIGWARRGERPLAWGAEFIAHDLQTIAKGECLVYYAFERDSGAYVGRVDLHSWDFDAPRCEVGYVGDVLTAGRGLMREAVLACVQMAFDLGVARVQALSEASNHRALYFAEHALGFVREGVLKHYERDVQGRLGEQVMFAAYGPALP